MQIRSYQPEDFDPLMAILWQHITQAFAPEEAIDFARYLQHEREDYFVVESGIALAGAGGINYLDEGRTACLSWDLVAPEFQGCGLGSALAWHRLNHIRTQSRASQIVVRTSQMAYAFYARFGFVLIRIQPNYWAPGFDLYEMKMQA